METKIEDLPPSWFAVKIPANKGEEITKLLQEEFGSRLSVRIQEGFSGPVLVYFNYLHHPMLQEIVVAFVHGWQKGAGCSAD